MCEKCPSSIWCRDSNPRPLEHESLPITTRSGLPPQYSGLLYSFASDQSNQIFRTMTYRMNQIMQFWKENPLIRPTYLSLSVRLILVGISNFINLSNILKGLLTSHEPVGGFVPKAHFRPKMMTFCLLHFWFAQNFVHTNVTLFVPP